jgi:predicted acetyltransferase
MGIGSQLMREVLAQERARGVSVSALYPATVPVYRRLGYEFAGTYTQYTTKVRSLPASEGGPVHAFDQEDPEPLGECFRRFAEGQNGVIESEAEDWWPTRILRRVGPEVVSHTVVVPGADGIDGYAAFTREDLQQDFGFRLSCTHLVANTRQSLESLLGYFRRFQGIGRELRWQGPPNEPIALLLPEQSLQATFTFRFMLRILDVAAALEGRGYPDVDGEATIAVTDELFPDNAGTYELTGDGGKVKVERVDRKAPSAVPIGMLSALYSGYLTPEDLVRLGHLEGSDPAVTVLARLFAGPPPWMPDWF